MAELSQREVHDAYQELYNAITDAYWAASTIQDKDRLMGLSEAVYNILTKLNADGIRSRSVEYADVREGVNEVNGRLSKLADDIATIVHRVNVAAQVTNGISKALDFSAKFFV